MRKGLLSLLFLIWIFSLNAFAHTHLPTYGPTRDSDNLFRIASIVRPSNEVSIQQVMLALLAANRHAFLEKNINSLMTGYVLRIPPIEIIDQISEAAAEKEVNRQNRIWQGTQFRGRKRITRAKHTPGSAPVIPSVTRNLPQIAKTKSSLDGAIATSRNKGEYTHTPPQRRKGLTPATPNTTKNLPQGEKGLVPVIPSATKDLSKGEEVKDQSSNLPVEPLPIEQSNLLKQEFKAIVDHLQQQLDEIVKSDSQLQLDLNRRLNNVEQQNQLLQNKILQTDQIVQSLQTNLQQLTNETASARRINKLLDNLGAIMLIALAALILFLLLYYFTKKYSRKIRVAKELPPSSINSIGANSPTHHGAEDLEDMYAADTEDEYDYMNSEEGIAAKLDLARAYMDMDDFAAAKNELEQVILRGNEQQRQEAQALLDQITEKSA